MSTPIPIHVPGRAMRWAYRTVPMLASLTVAAASFALSFVALMEVSIAVQAVPAHMAWLVPIVIDGGVMGASAVIWAQASMRVRRSWFPFFVVGVLVVLSVIVNAAHAGPSVLAKVIAALPPMVLLATLELAALSMRHGHGQPVTVTATVSQTGPVDASLTGQTALAGIPGTQTGPTALPIPQPAMATAAPVPTGSGPVEPARKPASKSRPGAATHRTPSRRPVRIQAVPAEIPVEA